MKIEVVCRLPCYVFATVDIPIESWKEVKKFFVLGDVLYYSLNGFSFEQVKLSSNFEDAINWYRPMGVEILDPESKEVIA